VWWEWALWELVSARACLVLVHVLYCVESDEAKRRTARARLFNVLKEAYEEGVIQTRPTALLSRFTISGAMDGLKPAQIVVESTVEDPLVKRKIIGEIERVVSPRALIGSNTSAIPLTELQSAPRTRAHCGPALGRAGAYH